MLKRLLDAELAYRKEQGQAPVSVAEFTARFAALGYQVDRSMDCRALARYMTGERAGTAYPCCSTGMREADTKLSAYNRDARRDERFQAMQKLRGEIFAVSRGHILEA
jgi:hypothetical protein